MKFSQGDVFQPITITLETLHEAQALWDIIRRTSAASDEEIELLCAISNAFSNEAIL
jgi:hypothetical protein